MKTLVIGIYDGCYGGCSSSSYVDGILEEYDVDEMFISLLNDVTDWHIDSKSLEIINSKYKDQFDLFDRVLVCNNACVTLFKVTEEGLVPMDSVKEDLDVE